VCPLGAGFVGPTHPVCESCGCLECEQAHHEPGALPTVARRLREGPEPDVPHYTRHTKNKLEHVVSCVSGVT
jgi:hypothetical protein